MRLLVWGTGLVADQFMSTVKEEVIGFVSKDEPSENFCKKYLGGAEPYIQQQI